MSPELAPGRPSRKPRVVLTLGKFDGVHAGHRHLAASVIQAASSSGCAGAALVLHPHPASVISGVRIPLLTSIAERRRRLKDIGLDIVEPLHFTPEVAALGPDDFVDRLCQRFEVARLIVGPDFAFGRGRSGDLATLRGIAARRDFAVSSVEPLAPDGASLSSKRVREMIEAGEVEAARSAMREPVLLQGTVVHGAARGRELGFPTANLDLGENFCVPGNGIYAVQARWSGRGADDARSSQSGGRWLDGVASIGVRPTFDNGPRSVEVFLLDFSGDLYGRTLDVRFIARQRGEERFERVEDLVSQMHRDVEIGRAILAQESTPGWQVVRTASGPVAHVRGFDLADLFQNVLRCVPALRRGYGVAGSSGDVGTEDSPPAIRQHLRLPPEGQDFDPARSLGSLLRALPSSLLGGSIHCASKTGIEGLLRRSAAQEAAGEAGRDSAPIDIVDAPTSDAWGGFRVSLRVRD